jgi:hypothetical protein
MEKPWQLVEEKPGHVRVVRSQEERKRVYSLTEKEVRRLLSAPLDKVREDRPERDSPVRPTTPSQ